jgi:hypothetical protein
VDVDAKTPRFEYQGVPLWCVGIPERSYPLLEYPFRLKSQRVL